MNRFFLALQLLTIVRLKRLVDYGPGEPPRALAWFPVVGALLGAAAASFDALLLTFLPPLAAAASTVALLAVLTGALHLDGFADTVDALAGGSTADERLRIMKDPAVGAVGVAAVALLIVIKCSAIAGLDGWARWRALFIMPVVGRWAIAHLAWRSKPARPDGLGASLHPVPGFTVFAAAFAAAACLLVSSGPAPLLIMAAVGLIGFLAARFFAARTGGATGDVYGFWCESTEMLTLVLLYALTALLGADQPGR